MINRWTILGVLFLARLTMAFQFQSVAALSPMIVESYAISLTEIGLLIGLYLGPGIVVALPGGAIAAALGDKRVVGASLLLMLLGALIIQFGSGWTALLIGRVLGGIGGVIINVVMTKMLLDWFVGHEIGTAMGIFISSWPAGIALALLTLPGLAGIAGLAGAWFSVTGLILLAAVLFLLIYRPATVQASGPASLAPRQRLPFLAISLAAGIWGLYNAAFAMVFAFGPLLLVTRGLGTAEASFLVSLFIIATGLSVPLGGVLADRSGRRDAVILVSLSVSAITLPAIVLTTGSTTAVVLALGGVIFGLAGGPIMTLPGDVLKPENRALGSGVFFTIYYLLMMIAPPFAGGIADSIGRADVALHAGAGMLVVCGLLLAGFRSLKARQASRQEPES